MAFETLLSTPVQARCDSRCPDGSDGQFRPWPHGTLGGDWILVRVVVPGRSQTEVL